MGWQQWSDTVQKTNKQEKTHFVVLYSPALNCGIGDPPAIPQGSYTGESPGALQGLKRQKS
jgi:hypothetical protein